MNEGLPEFVRRPTMPEPWADRGGIPFTEAPILRRWHRCRPWTVGYLGQRIERCACGAMRSDIAHFWQGRNSRRRSA